MELSFNLVVTCAVVLKQNTTSTRHVLLPYLSFARETIPHGTAYLNTVYLTSSLQANRRTLKLVCRVNLGNANGALLPR
eukprot:m.80391 g.80391  ORF g.80391 m.80391 type:complete len:79 (-) comp50689_c0_seq7:1648-1884(-)